MKAVQIEEYGGPSKLIVNDLDVPRPGPLEVLLKTGFAGINFIDVYMREGVYQNSHTYKNSPPFTLGMEGVGVVAEVGAEVDKIGPDTLVAWCLEPGSYAEYAVVPAWKCVPVPASVDIRHAVTLMLQGSTAHYLSHSLFDLTPGDTCLVHAGAGGVGQLLVQIARIKGARVLATVSTDEKAQIVTELGGEPIHYRKVDFADEVLRLTEQEGVDVVYDGVGQSTYQGSLRATKRRGMVALFGGASGAVHSISPLDLAENGSLFLTRPHLADYIYDKEERHGRCKELFDWVADGTLKVRIDEVFPLTDARAAHERIEAGKTKGKILLEV